MIAYIPRTLASHIHKVNDTFPVLLVTGPRQVGKTTLLMNKPFFDFFALLRLEPGN